MTAPAQHRPTIWQVTGTGVRPVVILGATGANARIGTVRHNTDGQLVVRITRGPRGTAPLTDLFPKEGDARDALARRRALTHRANDRRRHVAPHPETAAPS